MPEHQGLVQVVRHEDDRPLHLALDLEEQVLHVPPDERVEGAERLVHEQKLLLGGQSSREPHPLLHAARQLRGHLLALALQTDQLQRLLAGILALRGRRALDLEAEGHVVHDRAGRQKAEVLEDHPDLAPPHLP